MVRSRSRGRRGGPPLLHHLLLRRLPSKPTNSPAAEDATSPRLRRRRRWGTRHGCPESFIFLLFLLLLLLLLPHLLVVRFLPGGGRGPDAALDGGRGLRGAGKDARGHRRGGTTGAGAPAPALLGRLLARVRPLRLPRLRLQVRRDGVHDLLEASKTYETLTIMVDKDVDCDTVKKPGSHSRNLRRVRQGLDLIKTLFEKFLSSYDFSLREAASTAYEKVCAPYHTWAIRTAVYAGMYALPTRDQLVCKLNETHHSVRTGMQRYIDASSPIIEYIDTLYLSRNITLDW